MKKILFASAMAAATLVAAPALAKNGYVGLSGSHTEVDVSGFDADGKFYSLFGSGIAPLGDGLGLQYDGAVTFSDIDGFDDDTAFSGGLHLYHEAGAGKFGAFAGVSTSDDFTAWDIGGEGQSSFGNVILGGAVGYFNVDDLDADGWGARVRGSVFPNDNFRLYGGFGLFTAEADDVDLDVDGWTAGGGAEFQLTDSPFGFFADYEHGAIDDFDLEVDTIRIGVTYNWLGTLRNRETSGPSLRGLGFTNLLRF